MSKKILAFVYDFAHEKSALGLTRLKECGFDDVTCIAAPKKKLNITHSQTRITPIYYSMSPERLAKAFGYKYIKQEHDTLPSGSFDLGLILGARVLKGVTQELPIINLHPGLLPQNRGLDNVKWAVFKSLPQAITAHIVDEKIDRGSFLFDTIVDVYPDDTLLDIHLRLLHEQIDVIPLALSSKPQQKLDIGVYHSPMTPAQDSYMLKQFDTYKQNYELIRGLR